MDEMHINIPPSHVIITLDGGHDDLLPGRWIADCRSFLHDVPYEHGRTEEEAVANLRAAIARKHPDIPWFRFIPYRQQGHPPRPISIDGGEEES